jgi:TRAF3-interacting protein 1
MAEENAKPWVINTQNTLGTYVKNPKLTAKLLSRPPFRFLHDTVMAFMKATNLLNGLFQNDELDGGRAGADKESKVKFLDKLINCVQYATGEPLRITSAAIIAGKDAEYTNQMLSKLASLGRMPPAVVNEAVAKTVGGSPASSAQPDKSPRKRNDAPQTPAEADNRVSRDGGGA